ncbi:hypothetical protein glysoja_020084 [Glycine soja]|nr:hypothetical protein glysoja_020084 [Glycine soja]
MATFSIGTHTCPCSSICIILDFHFMASAPLNHHPSLAPLPAESDSQNLTPESGSCDPLCSLDETSSQEFEDSYQPKTDFLKAVAILAAAATGALTINHSWVATNQDLAMALLFVIGYAGIIFEESPAFNKSGVGLLMAVSLWVIRSIGISGFAFAGYAAGIVPYLALHNLNISLPTLAEVPFLSGS